MLASRLEATVRAHGGIPATIGVLDGVARVGMNADELLKLVSPSATHAVLKVSRRDLGYICGLGLTGSKRNGGTTVAGTMLLAHLAGIKVFATGGLGGVHRGGQESMDISADLTELGRTPVAVISSGCKSFLDIPRTLEYLETQGVCVATFADHRQGPVDFPAFWSRDSGILSPVVLQDEVEAAAIIHAQATLPLATGLLFANPIPAKHSIAQKELDQIIADALQDAHDRGVTGKDNTPHVLSRIKELTRGKSVVANSALVEYNVIRGTKVAVELSKLERGESDHREAENVNEAYVFPLHRHEEGLKSSVKDSPVAPQRADILVAGSLAIDLACDYAPSAAHAAAPLSTPQQHTSNPAVIGQTMGGVGYNVASAARLLGADVVLCTRVGDDMAGRSALAKLVDKGMRLDGVKMSDPSSVQGTAQYVAINDADKNMVMAMADMRILESTGPENNFDESWTHQIHAMTPKWVIVDANWDYKTLHHWVTSSKAAGARVAYEPVSVAKSRRLFAAAGLRVYPNHDVDLATPNAMELAAMHAAARESEQLERQDWWRLIDSLGISSGGESDRLAALTSRAMVKQGIPQQSIQLLPFIPSILTKLGSQGVLLTRLLASGDPRLSMPAEAPFIMTRSYDDNSPAGGVYLRVFPTPAAVAEEEVVSVNGAGDTFLGTLVAGLTAKHHDMNTLIGLAQRASAMTLKSPEAVHPQLAELKAEVMGRG
ncbi:MAG: hypothetical protein M1838_004593 [Thelocarpon superellum]|nr:MAG: hypothetical protein M1838_004593 [Thelocarpon superellum]